MEDGINQDLGEREREKDKKDGKARRNEGGKEGV